MLVPNLIYGTSDASDRTLSPVSVFSDRPHLQAMIRDEVHGLGFPVAQVGSLEALFSNMAVRLAQVIFVDCPEADSAHLANLAELDMVVARQGVALIVSTTVGALDAVFGCLDQSEAQILVDPSPAERSLALGRIMLGQPQLRVGEISDENRLLLLRLTEQVSNMAARLDRLAPPAGEVVEGKESLRLQSPRQAFVAQGTDQPLRASRPALPDPRLVRRIINQRQMRGKFFDPELFADPAWDMLLDLTAARVENIRVSITSLCIASCVPPTTALRWIGHLTEAGLVKRVEDQSDRRRAFVALTDKAADAMAQFFIEIGNGRTRVI